MVQNQSPTSVAHMEDNSLCPQTPPSIRRLLYSQSLDPLAEQSLTPDASPVRLPKAVRAPKKRATLKRTKSYGVKPIALWSTQDSFGKTEDTEEEDEWLPVMEYTMGIMEIATKDKNSIDREAIVETASNLMNYAMTKRFD